MHWRKAPSRSDGGWLVSLFFALPLPMLTPEGSSFGRSFGEWHQTMEWALLIVIGIHVAAALALSSSTATGSCNECCRKGESDRHE
jgi:cytochrome b561